MKIKHEAFCPTCAYQAYIEGASGPCSGCIPDSAESNWMPIEVDIIAVKSTRDASFGIARQCDTIKEMLLEKNRKYGNSALEPKRIFSRASPLEQINVRIDDKLSRLMSAQSDEDEDVDLDLIGYLILRRVAKEMQQ
jgi:hypothetical protein